MGGIPLPELCGGFCIECFTYTDFFYQKQFPFFYHKNFVFFHIHQNFPPNFFKKNFLGVKMLIVYCTRLFVVFIIIDYLFFPGDVTYPTRLRVFLYQPRKTTPMTDKKQLLLLGTAPGTSLPYWPSIDKKYTFTDNLFDSKKLHMLFSTVLRIKGKDGLYRDITCSEKTFANLTRGESEKDILDIFFHHLSLFITKAMNTGRFYIADNEEPSCYQLDELERTKAMTMPYLP